MREMLSMSLANFLADLFETGMVRVGLAPATAEDRKAIESWLADIESEDRLNLAGDPPAFDRGAASWAAGRLYTAAQLLVNRDANEQDVRAALADPGPTPTAAAHYSVDLAFRYLPDLLVLARRVSEEDPLVEALQHLIAPWPLASLGIRDVPVGDIEPIVAHPCLRQLYVDRIVARGDVARLDDPRVQEAVREALGACPELAPAISARLAAACAVTESDTPLAGAGTG
ncbi:MAG TPA: hypothetical protein VHB77_14620 [Planctomycetaceae bacterium]|nr:hypothetical protein [Planctomycetaceae bacterium]